MITYAWKIEVLDKDGTLYTAFHGTKGSLSYVLRQYKEGLAKGNNVKIALVRTDESPFNTVTSTCAHVEGDTLQDYFYNGNTREHKVPARFITLWNKHRQVFNEL